MVHVIRSVALAVQPDITGLDPFRVDQAAFVDLDVFLIPSNPQTGGIVMIVVERRPDILRESRIIRDLDNDI